MNSGAPAILDVQGISVGYGPIDVLSRLSVAVASGSVTSIIGPNGAGKSTLLKSISSLIPCRSGKIIYDGRHDLTYSPAHKAVAIGIAHVPEGRQVFGQLSVQDNLDLGAYHFRGRHADKQALGTVFDYFPRLFERRKQAAGSLSGGEQQMLVIGRALVSRPRLLLLDEPSMGLAPQIVQRIFDVLEELNRSENMSILLVEQSARQALAISNYAYVLNGGQIAAQGLPDTLMADDVLRGHYLGGKARGAAPRTERG